jgi:hypothetical protein
MHDHDEFLWTGLRARLERTGKVPSHTTRLEAVRTRPERRHAEVVSHRLKTAPRAGVR